MSSNRRNSRPRVEEFRRKNTTRSAPKNPPQISAATPPRPSTAPSTLIPRTSGPRAQPYPPTGRPTRRQATGRKSQDQEEEGEKRTEAAPPGPRSASPASSRPRSASIGGEEGRGQPGAACCFVPFRPRPACSNVSRRREGRWRRGRK